MKNILLPVAVIILLFAGGCKKDTGGLYTGLWSKSTLTLNLNSDNSYTLTSSGSNAGSGKFTVSGTQLNFTDSSGVCPPAQTGSYSFNVYTNTTGGGYYGGSVTTTYMSLHLSVDSCAWRSGNLPGTYTKQ